jgi:hypothetical protein
VLDTDDGCYLEGLLLDLHFFGEAHNNSVGHGEEGGGWECKQASGGGSVEADLQLNGAVQFSLHLHQQSRQDANSNEFSQNRRKQMDNHYDLEQD